MFDRIIDENNPRYTGPLPRPRGLLPVPPEITEELARTQAAHPLKKFADSYVKMTCDDWTLTYYYVGLTGVINQVRLTFDGTYSLIAPYGLLIVEKT
jgi:hypothetical protein